MSKFEVQLDEELETRIIRVLEPIRFEDLLQLFERDIEPRILSHTIWEFEPGSLKLLNLDDLKRFMSIRRTNIERRRGGYTVLVAHESSERMLAKWYKSFAEELPFHDVQFRLASSLEEAKTIIGSIRESRA